VNTTRTALAALVLAAAAGTAAANMPDRVLIQARASTQHLHGEYTLADGRLLVVGRHGGRLVAAVDGQPRQALRALSDTRWASADGRLTIEFHATPNQSVSGVTLLSAR
jgi:hypothetical protein